MGLKDCSGAQSFNLSIFNLSILVALTAPAKNQQKLLVAARAANRRWDRAEESETEAGAELLDLGDNAALRHGRPHDAAAGNFPAPGFELRLGQNDHSRARREQRHDARKHEPD
jgi:hypothetical protein